MAANAETDFDQVAVDLGHFFRAIRPYRDESITLVVADQLKVYVGWGFVAEWQLVTSLAYKQGHPARLGFLKSRLKLDRNFIADLEKNSRTINNSSCGLLYLSHKGVTTEMAFVAPRTTLVQSSVS